MAEVMKLGLILSATDKMSRIIDQATGKSLKSMNTFQRNANKIGGSVQKVGLGILGTGMAVATTMFGFVKSTASNAKEISRASQRVAMSTESFQVYAEAAKRSGVESDKFQAGVAKLMKNQVDAAKGGKKTAAAFNELGISLYDSHGMLKKSDVLIRQISEKFHNAPDGPKKTALAMTLFSRSGQVLIPMLNKGAKGLDALSEEMKRNGTILDDDAIAKSKIFNEKLRDMSEKFEGVKNKIAVAVMPAFTRLADRVLEITTRVTDWISNNKELIRQLLHWSKIAVEVGVAIWGIGTAIKAIVIISKTYNFILGITMFFHKTMPISIGKNVMALKGLSLMTKIASAAQWLWNAAMSANPIGLIIVGVAAVIGLIALVVAKWNSWGAALSVFMGPLGFIISLFESFYKNWEMIKTAFKTGGIIGGLKAIGKTILDAVLMPIEQLLSLISKIPGVGKLINPALQVIHKIQQVAGISGVSEKILPVSKINKAVESKVKKQEKVQSKIEQIHASNQSNINKSISTQQSTSNNSPALNYTYNVSINGGSTGDVDSFKKMLQDHKRDILEIMRSASNNQQRVSYNPA
jgi:hypothetical protein